MIDRRSFVTGMAGAPFLLPHGASTPRASGERKPHFRPRAKHVIYMHMAGSPPQQDLFDHKPALNKFDGKKCPDEFLKEMRFAFIKGHPKLLGNPHALRQHGEQGTWVSDLLPHTAQIIDKLSLVYSLQTDQFNHAPAQLMLQTGAGRLGRPSIGAWVSWALGSLSADLPAFCVLVSGGGAPSAGKSVWGSGFLPTIHQGVQLRGRGDPVLYLGDPPGVDRKTRRRMLDSLRRLNEHRLTHHQDPETRTRIAQFELAYRMQDVVPQVADLRAEPQHIRDLYGADPERGSFANNCLLARRLVENGVRFVQLYDRGWDIHGTGPHDDLMTQFPKKCGEIDRACAGLILDLEQRGLLDDTLVVWGGEFGRTPMNEERNGSKFFGRDHHPLCQTVWMAGGGVRPGARIGATDELGYRVVEDPIHVHDLQATILHLLGFDHEQLTFRFQGRDFRLTDVHGHVARQLLA